MSSVLLRGLGMRTAVKAASGPANKRAFSMSITDKQEALANSLRPDGKIPNTALEISFALFLGCAVGGMWTAYAQYEFTKLDSYNAKLKNMREMRDN